MKLKTTTWISMDGVMQGLGDAEEDRRGGFERGGWAMPLSDQEVEKELNAVYEQADAFFFGKWTYEVFAGSWGTIPEMVDSPIGHALNSKPKYVASRSLSEAQWEGTTVLSGDLGAELDELKRGSEGELLVPGGTTLVRWLLENGQVDEVNLFTAPVVIGQGNRLFPETGPDIGFELADSTVTSNGMMIGTYRTSGTPRYGKTDDTTDAWSE